MLQRISPSLHGFLQGMEPAEVVAWYKLAGGVPRIWLKQSLGSRERFQERLQRMMSACNVELLKVLIVLTLSMSL